MNRLIFFSFILFFSGELCSMEYNEVAHNLFNQHSSQIVKKFGLEIMGLSSGNPYDVLDIGATYKLNKVISIEDARSIYVEIAEGFIKKFNSHRTLRPYMHSYPFSIKNLSIVLCFASQKDGESVVSLMSDYKGDLIYFKGWETGPYIEKQREPYKEAVQIVQQKS